MKQYSYYPVAIVSCALGIVSCSKQSGSSSQPPEVTVTISSIAPTTVKGGDILTVFGKNLLKDLAHTSLFINGKLAQITLSANDSIKAIVPAKAGTGTVTLKVGDQSYDGPLCTYEYKVSVSTIAGNGSVGNSDGLGLQSSFNCPWGIAANAQGDLFVADSYNRLIRKITASDYYVS